MKLLKLYQPDCPPCTAVENFLQDQRVEYQSVNVRQEPDAAMEFGVMSTPVTILFDDEGNEVMRSRGFNGAELEEMVSQL